MASHSKDTVFRAIAADFDISLPGRFEQIAQMYPNRIAVKTRTGGITYSALNRTANRIGRAVLERIGSDSEPVALLLEKGIDLIAALIGVLKAGKFFVAIDPSFPPARIAYMIRNSETRLLMTNSGHRDFAKTLMDSAGGYLNIDEIGGETGEDNLNLPIMPDQIATIVYTSGSTAEPKGVVKSHAYSLERAEFTIEFLRITPEDRLSLLHSVSFGSGETNLYTSLLSGATLLPFDAKSEGGAELVRWLEDEQITVLHCPPSLFRHFVQFIPDYPVSNLRLINLSGSPIIRSDVEAYKKYCASRILLTFHMGATEAGWIACALVDHKFSFPHIGTPAGYVRKQKNVLILDDEGRELKRGETGEIAVKSRFLAQGYWKDPELTKARFLPAENGERIYLTGDIGQLRSDGFLIHQGRKDFMVKIRGYRVEIGEVERALLADAEIKEAAVISWEREAGEACLVAYVVSAVGSLPVDKLGAFLRGKLPDYMIPSVFIFLDSLPKTNGKLDRRALPKPDRKRPQLSSAYEPPSTDIERSLAAIWSEVLNINLVGIRDDFFDLGGNSLSATRVCSRIRDEYELEVPLRIMSEHPTIRELALVLTTMQADRAREPDVVFGVLEELECLSEDRAKELIADRRRKG